MGRNKIRCEFMLELQVEVKASIQKEVLGGRHYPYEPASIDDLSLKIMGEEISIDLYNKITEVFEDSINEEVWDKVKEEREEREMSEDNWREDR